MLIVHGRKVHRKPLGVVADSCCFCCRCRAFDAVHVIEVSHLYGVSIGGDRVLATEITCRACGGLFARDRRAYRRAADREPADFGELVAETNPPLLEFAAQAEARFLGLAALAPDARRRMLRDAVAGTAYLVQRRSVSDTRQSLCAVLALVAMILGTVAAYFLFIDVPIRWAYAAGPLAAAAIAIPAAVWMYATQTTWAASRYGLPLIGRAAALLRTSPEDIDAVLAELRAAKHPTARMYRAASIVRAALKHAPEEG